MVDVSKVHITLVLRERKVYTAKYRVNVIGFNVLDESTKTMRVQDIEYVSEESIQGKMQESVISTYELEALGMQISMEQANEFMGDCIVFIEGVIFQKEKKVGGVEHGSV